MLRHPRRDPRSLGIFRAEKRSDQMSALSDEPYMRQALALAEKGRGTTSPNPMVGAIVVKDGGVVGSGFHERAGGPHAEVVALDAAGDATKGATLYVTLEPCSHYGRTPPCADLIVDRSVARVVYAMADPNPVVAGRGAEKLRGAGIETTSDVLREEACRLNEAYIKHITTGTPFVTLKLAQTLDGKIATCTGDSKWITGIESRRRVHRLRAEVDAVLVGINTALTDDPMLTVRLVEGRDPLRMVLDSSLRLPPTARMLSAGRTVVVAREDSDPARARALQDRGAEIWAVPGPNGRPDLVALMREAGRREITSVLIEGGAEVAGSALRAGIVDRLMVFLAPKIIGAGRSAVADLGVSQISEALRVRDVEIERVGEDLLYIGRPVFER